MRLSICIPTYNFGPFIGETLRSILPQLRDGVEVVILDGGSTDDTPAVVASFQHPAVRYHHQEHRGGIDRDLARTIELAGGEYCWIFCADDIMKPGAVQHVLDRLVSGADLYLCGFTLCTFEMRRFRDHPIARIPRDQEFDLSSVDQRLDYFGRAQTTPAFFSFAGSLIFRKDRWTAAGPDERFVGSLWAHVAQIFRMLPLGLRLHFIPDSLLDKRSGNDSFLEHGMADRIAKAIDGYHLLARTYFPQQSPEAHHIRRVITNEFPPWVLFAAKLDSRRNGYGNGATVDRLAAVTYGDPTPRNRIYRLLYELTPLSAFAAVQTFNRRVVLPRRGMA
jgi:O-antigen biosynthesis alpha-1,3-abequosyltransferase